MDIIFIILYIDQLKLVNVMNTQSWFRLFTLTGYSPAATGGNPDKEYIWNFFVFSHYIGITDPKTVFCRSITLGQKNWGIFWDFRKTLKKYL